MSVMFPNYKFDPSFVTSPADRYGNKRRTMSMAQPGPRCGACSVSALCGNADYDEYRTWLDKRRLLHVHCPLCDRHGVFSVRTGIELFPAPETCPIVSLGKPTTKICLACYKGQQIQHGGTIEPEFEQENEDGATLGKRRWFGTRDSGD